MGIALSSIGFAQDSLAEPQTSILKEGIRGNPSKVDSAEEVAHKEDAIIMKNDALMVRKDDKLSPMEADMTLKDGTIVMKNGTVKTTGGDVIVLISGDEVTMDGKIMKRDLLVFRDGKMLIKRDGKLMPMIETQVIEDGTQVMMDGTIMMKDGETKKLKDGQQIDWEGRVKDGDIIKPGPPGKRQ